MKRFFTIFAALLFSILSFNAFVQNDLGSMNNFKWIMGLFVDIYDKLIGIVGFMGTGILFALCAIGIIIAAILDKPNKNTSN